MHCPSRLVSVALSLCLFAPLTRAQCFDWARGLGAPGASATVEAQVVFDDGSGPALFLGGSFTSLGQTQTGPVARWDGTSVVGYGQALNGTVYSLCVFDSGAGPELYAGGGFTIAGANVNIARWNGSGWTPLAGGVNRSVRSLQVHDDGTGPALIVAGAFWQANDFPLNTPVNHVGSWNGSAWTPLWTGVGGYMSESDFVYALASFDDGSGGGKQLYAGGHFDHVGSSTQYGIARWNGSAWLPLGAGLAASSDVHGLQVWDDGSGAAPRLALFGSLKPSGQTSFWPLVTWDGSALAIAAGLALGDVVQGAGTHDDGSGPALYLSGRLTIAGQNAIRIVRWNGTGFSSITSSMDLSALTLGSFDPGTGPQLVAGGYFSQIEGQSAAHCARWRTGSWSPLAPGLGLQGAVNAFALFADGSGAGADLYAGGQAAYPAGGGRVGHWNGSAWTQVGADFSGPVLALASFDDGAGPLLFASARNASSSIFISTWNGSAWQPRSTPPDMVRCFAVHDDHQGGGPALYAGVLHSDPFNDAPALVWRWNSGAWSPLPSPGSHVSALCSFDDGQGPALFVGGRLTAGLVCRWDGVAWSSIGNASGNVTALAVFDDGSGPALYAGGDFTSMNGVPALRIAKWNGTQWSAVGGGFDARVDALCVHNEGFGAPYLVAGGSFTHSQANLRNAIARWNGASWSALGSGLSGTQYAGAPTEVLALASFDDGLGSGRDLYAGGNLLAAGGLPSSYFAKWEGCGGTGTPYCFGDGSLALDCPCSNLGGLGRGCANSAVAAGAGLRGSGVAQPDTIVLTGEGLLPSALAIFLQGDLVLSSGALFGDGLRCTGGHLLRLAVKHASGGSVSYPEAGDLAITRRAAQLGAPIPSPAMRSYQVYYRDPSSSFCPAPTGATWNVTNALRIVW